MFRQQATKKATTPAKASIVRTAPRGVRVIVNCGVIAILLFQKRVQKYTLFPT